LPQRQLYPLILSAELLKAFANETFENDPQTPPERTNLVEPTRLYLKPSMSAREATLE
jgi:hypothetical protein